MAVVGGANGRMTGETQLPITTQKSKNSLPTKKFRPIKFVVSRRNANHKEGVVLPVIPSLVLNHHGGC